MDRPLTLKGKKKDCSPVDMKMNGVYNYMRTKCQFRFRQSTTNRYQSITTRIFAMDWSSIININRLIDIDWYRLILIVIDYRFHRLDTPGLIDSDAKLSMYL